MSHSQAMDDVEALLRTLSQGGPWEASELIRLHGMLRALRESLSGTDQARAMDAVEHAADVVERIVFGEAQGMPTWGPIFHSLAASIQRALASGVVLRAGGPTEKCCRGVCFGAGAESPTGGATGAVRGHSRA